MKRALVTGAGGFLGNHMVNRLKSEGYWVRGIDVSYPAFSQSVADDFVLGDLRWPTDTYTVMNHGSGFDELYHFAANMGGMDYIESAEYEIIHDSALINLNVFDAAVNNVGTLFFSSSACVYRDMDEDEAPLNERQAYPAMPDSEYGWEKLFAERVAQTRAAYGGYSLRIGRLENVYGPLGAYQGGREKAPAALCRKVARTASGGTINVYGGGSTLRSFTYVADMIEAIRTLMLSAEVRPVNIGPDSELRIDQLVELIAQNAHKRIHINNVVGPLGVKRRRLHHGRIHALGWQPQVPLYDGIGKLYAWVHAQTSNDAN